MTVQNIDNPRTLDLFKSGRGRRRLAARAVELAAGRRRREGARRREVPVAGRPVPDHRADRPHRSSSRSTRRPSRRCCAPSRSRSTSPPPSPTQAKTVTNDAIKQLTNSSLAPAVLDRAFTELSFGSDPLAATFPQLAKDSVTAGICGEGDQPGRVRRRDSAEQRADRRGQADGGRRRTRQGSGMTPMTSTIERTDANRTGAPALTLRGVGKTFGAGPGAVTALRDIDLQVAAGRVRLPARAPRAAASRRCSTSSRTWTRPTTGELQVGTARPSFMFQEAALLPWLTARRNVELALQLRGAGPPRAPEPRRRAARAGAARRDRATSGRTSCRAACASACRWPGRSPPRQPSARPRADRGCCSWTSRSRPSTPSPATCCRASCCGCGEATGTTILFVTHDVREAIRLAQRVVLLSSRPGTVVREWRVGDGPMELHRPAHGDHRTTPAGHHQPCRLSPPRMPDAARRRS